MSETLESLGYLAAFFGAIFEGEASLITALQTARLGYTSFYGILLAGFLGTVCVDWSLFLGARKKGRSYLKNNQSLQGKLDRMDNVMVKHSNWLLIFYRFLYGFRIVLPVLFGLSGITIRKFAIFSLISTLLWLWVLSIVGYQLAEVISFYTGF